MSVERISLVGKIISPFYLFKLKSRSKHDDCLRTDFEADLRSARFEAGEPSLTKITSGLSWRFVRHERE
jgi:hypothetical protein